MLAGILETPVEKAEENRQPGFVDPIIEARGLGAVTTVVAWVGRGGSAADSPNWVPAARPPAMISSD
jgi:hypothetical protein